MQAFEYSLCLSLSLCEGYSSLIAGRLALFRFKMAGEGGFLDLAAAFPIFSHPESLLTVGAGGHRDVHLVGAVAAQLEDLLAGARLLLLAT